MISFKPVLKKNPKAPAAPGKYYPQVKYSGEVNFRTLSEELSDASTLNTVDVRAVLFALEKVLLKYLQEGKIVRFGDLGTFRTTIGGEGSETPEELSAASVLRKRIVFAPSVVLKHAVTTATVKKVQETP